MSKITFYTLLLNCLKNNKFSLFLFIVCSFLFFIFNLTKLDLPILEQHAFRQTQTALTVFYLLENGLSLSYETPVVGYPWSIPFEFPIYHSIVFFLVNFLHLPITDTGRFVSLIFGYFCLFPVYLIFKILDFSKEEIFYILSLIIATPIFIFWSGTFMIESTALFFALFFLYFSIKTFKNNIDNTSMILTFVFLSLALLQKITTALPILILVYIYYFFNFNLLKIRDNPKVVISLIFMLCLPVGIAYGWVHYTDSVKILNPIGSRLTSEVLNIWNFGTIEQRFSSRFWVDTIINRIFIDNSIHFLGVSIILAALLFKTNIYYKKIIMASLFLFILPLLIFTNLHIVHNYYQYSNFIFYIIALAISIFILTDFFTNKIRKFSNTSSYICSLSFLLMIIYSFSLFAFGDYGYARFKSLRVDNQTLKLSRYLKDETIPSQPIILFGNDWSSEVAFYSERKSLTVPPWGGFESDVLNNYKKYLPNMTPSRVINCYPSSHKNFLKINRVLNARFNFIKKIDNCKIYTLK